MHCSRRAWARAQRHRYYKAQTSESALGEPSAAGEAAGEQVGSVSYATKSSGSTGASAKKRGWVRKAPGGVAGAKLQTRFCDIQTAPSSRHASAYLPEPSPKHAAARRVHTARARAVAG